MNNSGSIKPAISVIMAVKNGEKDVGQAIESILNQTFTNFEFIIINDGSTDSTSSVIKSYRDSRIRFFCQENQGLSRTLNTGLSLARGAYIARQDHDDISLPERLEKQYKFLEAHPNCGLLGTAAEIWGVNGPENRFHNHPADNATLEFELIFNNPFVHTSWMFPAKIIPIIGLYSVDPDREPPEDYEYASRISRKFDVANLTEPLVIYRELPNSLSSQLRPSSTAKKKSFISRLALISSENIAFLNNLSFDNPAAIFFGGLIHGESKRNKGVSYQALKDLIIGAAQEIEKKHSKQLPEGLIQNKLDFLLHRYFMKSSGTPYFLKIYALASFSNSVKIFKVFFRRIYEFVHRPFYRCKLKIYATGSRLKDVARSYNLLPPKK